MFHLYYFQVLFQALFLSDKTTFSGLRQEFLFAAENLLIEISRLIKYPVPNLKTPQTLSPDGIYEQFFHKTINDSPNSEIRRFMGNNKSCC